MRAKLQICMLGLAACEAAPRESVAPSELASPRYEIRIAETELGANGHTKRDVFVFGVKADGTYADDAVVLGVDRASAGTFTKSALQLGPLGASTYFTPCDQATSGCLGAATLTVALASDPATTVASVPIQLVAPVHVSSAAPCRIPGISMFLDGQGGSPVRNGILRVVEWQTPFVEVHPAAGAKELRMHLPPRRPTQGNSWSIWIDSYQLGAPLAPGIYSDAGRALSQTAGKPGLSVSGNGSGCNTIAGAFEIHELVITSGTLTAATISFEQRCDGNTTALLEGCFRYEKP